MSFFIEKNKLFYETNDLINKNIMLEKLFFKKNMCFWGCFIKKKEKPPNKTG